MSHDTDTSSNPSKQITKSQKKILDAAVAIWGESASAKDSAYMARQLVQCTLPHKNPGDIPAWSRRNGKLTLTIRPGWDSRKKESYGYPYGIIPRLLLFWMVGEAVRTKSPRLELGRSFSRFMEELGLDSSRGGKRSDATRLKNQMERFFNSIISFDGDVQQDGMTGQARLNMTVASKIMVWWNPKQPEQEAFDSHVELSKDFYEAITAAPVPVDMRALYALKKSPLALDLYAWLTYEAFRAYKSGEARFVSWEQLHGQMGGEYANLDDFRKKGVNPALAKIKLVYPKLKLGKRQGGIEVLPESLPALQPRNVTIEGMATRIAPSTAERPTEGKPLKTTTIEKFRALYPRLDPYACKAAFDWWQAELDPEKQAKLYDRAFLGFAAKWAVGKV